MSTHVVMSVHTEAVLSVWRGGSVVQCLDRPSAEGAPGIATARSSASCCCVSHNFRSPGDDTMTACATSRARHAIHSIGEVPTPWLKQEPHPSAAKRKRRL